MTTDLFTPQAGDRIKCIEMMDDPHPVEPETLGTILFIDDMKQIHVKWDNGRSLALIMGVDKYELVGTNENVKNFTEFHKVNESDEDEFDWKKYQQELYDKLGIPRFDAENPEIEKLSDETITSFVKEISKAILTNYEVDGTLFSDYVSKSVQEAIDTVGITKYNVVEEKYDDLGNAIIKLVNLGYSIGVDREDDDNTRFSFEDFFNLLDNLPLKKVNNDDLPKYEGPEIEHHSVLATTFNIGETFDYINDGDDHYTDKERFTYILGKVQNYGYAAFGEWHGKWSDIKNKTISDAARDKKNADIRSKNIR